MKCLLIITLLMVVQVHCRIKLVRPKLRVTLNSSETGDPSYGTTIEAYLVDGNETFAISPRNGSREKGDGTAKKLNIKHRNDPCHAAGGKHIGGQCFTFWTHHKNWQDAKESCASKDQHLATPRNPNALIEYVKKHHSRHNFWIGGSDIANEGTWIWLDGQLITSLAWASGEPNDYNGDEDCLELTPWNKYNDNRCSRKHYYICEVPDPCKVHGGKRIGGVCFTFVKHQKSWQDAKKSCEAKGQHLATPIDAQALQTYVNKHYRAHSFWIGGSDITREGSWIWLNGHAIKSLPWANGEPNDHNGNEDCLQLTPLNKYNDNTCYKKDYYICEVPVCGKVNRFKKIVGGVKTEMHEYPWQVSLSLQHGDGYYLCGGSLINNRWVLTAAHCTRGSISVRVTLGNHLMDQTESAEITINARRWIDHPDYTGSAVKGNDFSLLELDTSLDLAKISPHISPVCLPSADNPSQYDDVSAIVTGWGHTSHEGTSSNVLLEATVKTMTNTQCNHKYGYIDDSMICAAEEGKDACQGDSGGPLVTNVGGYYNLIGVTSFGKGCADPNYPGVYGRVSHVIPWITSTISQAGS